VAEDLKHSRLAITSVHLHVNPERGAGEVLAV
jgi:hypothetical protein